MDATVSYERRLPTSYERGYVLRSLSDNGLAMLARIAYKQIAKTRDLHGHYEEWNGEFLDLADQAIQKFTAWWLGDDAELTVTDKIGTPIDLDHSAMSVFKFRCCYGDICYSPRATTGREGVTETITVTEFNRSRCDHRLNPRHVGDVNGDVITDSNNAIPCDGEDRIPASYFYQPEDNAPGTVARKSRWIAVKNRILMGCQSSPSYADDDLSVSHDMIHDDPEWIAIGRARMGF